MTRAWRRQSAFLSPFAWVLAVAFSVALSAGPAFSAYPDRAIRLVVPFAPGGASDIVARLVAIPLAQALGQSVVVENRPGANGNLGIAYVAKADPDGYTLLLASSVFVVNPSISKQAAYDPNKDFAPIVDIGASPNVVVTRTESGINTVAEMIARARANPGELNFSSPGVGSISQLGLDLLLLREKIRMTHVPYTGAGPAVQAALSGTTQLAAVNISSAMAQIKAGALRALVQTGRERWYELPDVPTLSDAGVPDAASETYQSLFAPAGTPKEIVDRLAAEVIAIIQKPEMRERLQTSGLGVVAAGPDGVRARVAREVPMWQEIIAKTGLKVD